MKKNQRFYNNKLDLESVMPYGKYAGYRINYILKTFTKYPRNHTEGHFYIKWLISTTELNFTKRVKNVIKELEKEGRTPKFRKLLEEQSFIDF